MYCQHANGDSQTMAEDTPLIRLVDGFPIWLPQARVAIDAARRPNEDIEDLEQFHLEKAIYENNLLEDEEFMKSFTGEKNYTQRLPHAIPNAETTRFDHTITPLNDVLDKPFLPLSRPLEMTTITP